MKLIILYAFLAALKPLQISSAKLSPQKDNLSVLPRAGAPLPVPVANSSSPPPPPANSSSPLVPLADSSTLSFAAQQALLTIPFKRNLLSTLANAEGLFVPLMGVLGGTFDARIRILPGLDWQLIVLRIGKRADAPYVYNNNVIAASIMGMPMDKINALDMDPNDIVEGKGPWSGRDRLILRIVDEQLANRTNAEQTIEDALEVLTVPELVETLIIHGTYCTFAGVVRGLRVGQDSGAPGLEDIVRQIVTVNFVQPKEI